MLYVRPGPQQTLDLAAGGVSGLPLDHPARRRGFDARIETRRAAGRGNPDRRPCLLRVVRGGQPLGDLARHQRRRRARSSRADRSPGGAPQRPARRRAGRRERRHQVAVHPGRGPTVVTRPPVRAPSHADLELPERARVGRRLRRHPVVRATWAAPRCGGASPPPWRGAGSTSAPTIRATSWREPSRDGTWLASPAASGPDRRSRPLGPSGRVPSNRWPSGTTRPG